MAENKSLIIQNRDNNFHFDNYVYQNNNLSLNHNKDQIKELNFKYTNTTEELDLEDNHPNLNISSDNINPKIQKDTIKNKKIHESYYLNNHIPKIIEPNVYSKNSLKTNNNAFSSGASINYDPYPAYSTKTNITYNTNNSIEGEDNHGNLNSYLNMSDHNKNNIYTNYNGNVNNNNIPNLFESSTNSINLNSNLDKLLENLKNHSQELEGKNSENMKLKEKNCMLYDTIQNLETTCVGLREDNEYIIFFIF